MRSSLFVGTLVGAAAWLLAPPLQAQEQTEPAEPTAEEPTAPSAAVAPAPAVEPSYEVERTALPPSRYGIEVALGGGVTNFIRDAARDTTGVGGSWSVRVGVGTRTFAGFEAAYEGGAQDVTADGLDPDAYLLRNGLEGSIRLNAPLMRRDWLVEPFALVGVGWTRYDVVNDEFNTSSIAENDNLFVIPLGGGIAASYRGFMFDTRFTYRPTFDNDLIPGTELHSWMLSANIGREF